jgi:hypothetical protein
MARAVIAGLLAAHLCLTALGNEIIVWYSNPPGGFTIFPVQQTVLIWRSGTYRIKALNQSGGPGYIRSITVAQGVLGTVNLSVANEADGPGASDLGWVDLSNATVGNIVDLRLVLTLGSDPNDQATRATTISGAFQAPKSIGKDVWVGTLTAAGSFYSERLLADLYVTGAGPHAGSIAVSDLYYPHMIDVTGSMNGIIRTGSG